MAEIKVTVGRIVYYKTRGSADGVFPPANFASIVTEVDENSDVVSLATFGPSGIRFERGVTKGQEVGQWDWMPFQKDQQARLAPVEIGDASNSPTGNAHTATDTPAQQ